MKCSPRQTKIYKISRVSLPSDSPRTPPTPHFRRKILATPLPSFIKQLRNQANLHILQIFALGFRHMSSIQALENKFIWLCTSSHDESIASTPFRNFCCVPLFAFRCCVSPIWKIESVQAYFIKWKTNLPEDKY